MRKATSARFGSALPAESMASGIAPGTRQNADALGLNGWVRNLRDGSVEAVFSGETARVLQMVAKCHEGPSSAFVEKVAIVEEGAEALPVGFRILPTA